MQTLFGAKKKPMFGLPGMQQQEQPQPMMSAVQAPAQEQPKKGLGTRLFGQGWEDKAFALGGVMQGDPSGVYMMKQEKAREQQAAQAAQAAELQRAQELADWRMKEDYKRENPNPTSLQQNYEWLQQNDPQAAAAYKERMTNNYEYRQGADGQFYRVDLAEQPQVIGTELPQGWTVEGDASGNAGGGFPR